MQCCTYLHVPLLLLRQAGIPDTCILCARVSYACLSIYRVRSDWARLSLHWACLPATCAMCLLQVSLTLSKLPLPLRKKFHSASEISSLWRIISPHSMNENTSLSFSNRPLKYISTSKHAFGIKATLVTRMEIITGASWPQLHMRRQFPKQIDDLINILWIYQHLSLKTNVRVSA